MMLCVKLFYYTLHHGTIIKCVITIIYVYIHGQLLMLFTFSLYNFTFISSLINLYSLFLSMNSLNLFFMPLTSESLMRAVNKGSSSSLLISLVLALFIAVDTSWNRLLIV